MILRFRHKGLERLFGSEDTSGVNPQLASKLRRMLILLDRGKDASALNMPGYRLHPLKGDRSGQWSAMVSGNWRIVFEFDGENATNVDLVDYH
ncbi:type II toxin-antitoxin system RelE/ParE family toxin [Acidisphaera sp. L21]|uniref:type II toxin-antitoxin system RelE/ParE family toxin n=1 Tax=Acidisphaera sp. L21 TaxID=1641851 RepID=UPI00131DF0C8|nr:type II toxin-antitoxin system RelE/ParE family toxin [Acidisphaera sp. L21]